LYFFFQLNVNVFKYSSFHIRQLTTSIRERLESLLDLTFKGQVALLHPLYVAHQTGTRFFHARVKVIRRSQKVCFLDQLINLIRHLTFLVFESAHSVLNRSKLFLEVGVEPEEQLLDVGHRDGCSLL